jgi:pimeloyl-ACP methyl ester carboxylesterase
MAQAEQEHPMLVSLRLFAISTVAMIVASPIIAADEAGRVEIDGGRALYVECRGEGAPSVLIVAGAKASAEDWTLGVPGKLNAFDAIAGFTRVCAYDRPGTPVGGEPRSRSDAVPQPRTAAVAAADLKALIGAAGIPAPVVLVAHSYGGVIARLFARTYPEDVAGMVLVDALSEGLRAAETPEEWAIQLGLLTGDMTETLKLYPEIEQFSFDESFDELLAAPPLSPMPLAVLSADHPWGPLVPGLIADGTLPPDTPPDAGYVTDRAAKVAQANLAAAVPGARHLTDTDSGHEIHKDQPQLVVDQVRDVVEAVRAGRTVLEP